MNMKMENTTSHTAVPAKVTPSSPSPNLNTLPRRGHTRSASLENANSFNAKNTTGLPPIMVASTSAITGTLKSRNEQKRTRNKFGSHNNLEDAMGTPGRTKFQNIRKIFEVNQETTEMDQMQSLPIINSNVQQTPKLGTKRLQNQLHAAYKQQYAAQQQQQQQQQRQKQQQQQQQVNHNIQQQQQSISNQPHYHHQHYAHHQQHSTRKTTPTLLNGYGNRHSIAEVNERLNITEQLEQNKVQQPNQPQHYHSHHHHHHQQQQQQQHQQQPQKYNSLNTLHIEREHQENVDQTMTLLRPIAFKPIPFEPDYSIPNRYCDVVMMNERYGSTPSLAPVSGNNFRFGSRFYIKDTHHFDHMLKTLLTAKTNTSHN